MVSSVAPEHQQKFEDSGNQIGYEVKYRERLQFSLQWAADTKKQFQKPEGQKEGMGYVAFLCYRLCVFCRG